MTELLTSEKLRTDRIALELAKVTHPHLWASLTYEQRRSLVRFIRPDSSKRDIEKAFQLVRREQ